MNASLQGQRKKQEELLATPELSVTGKLYLGLAGRKQLPRKCVVHPEKRCNCGTHLRGKSLRE